MEITHSSFFEWALCTSGKKVQYIYKSDSQLGKHHLYSVFLRQNANDIRLHPNVMRPNPVKQGLDPDSGFYHFGFGRAKRQCFLKPQFSEERWETEMTTVGSTKGFKATLTLNTCPVLFLFWNSLALHESSVSMWTTASHQAQLSN